MLSRALGGVVLGLLVWVALSTAACRYQPLDPTSVPWQQKTEPRQYHGFAIGGVLAAGLALAGVGAALWRRRKRRRKTTADQDRRVELDRQDLALLRTAAESVSLLLRRVKRRLKLINRQGPGPGL